MAHASQDLEAFIGFRCSTQARQKVEALARDTRRCLTDVMRLLVDKATLQVVEISLEPAPGQGHTQEDTAAAEAIPV